MRTLGQVLTLVLALVVGATDAYFLITGNRSTAVSADDALDAFRAEADETAQVPGRGTVVPPSTPAAGEPSPAITSVAPPSQPQPAGTQPPAREPATPAPAAPPAAAPPAEQPAPTQTAHPPPAEGAPAPTFVLPAEGVYTYATEGYEQIQLAGGRHDYPSESQAILRHEDGCNYHVEHRVIEEHVDTKDLCNESDAVLLRGVGTTVTFFGQTESSYMTCTPPEALVRIGDEPGTTRTGECRSEDTRATETITYVGREDVTIGGVTVSAHHIVFDSRVSGRSNGTARSESWLHPDNGLVLRQIRDAETDSRAFGTDVHYEEHAEFRLTSLTPRT